MTSRIIVKSPAAISLQDGESSAHENRMTDACATEILSRGEEMHVAASVLRK
jgi:hypothetical protein